MILKPQDVVVAIKLMSYRKARPPMAQIAVDLKMAASEIHAALKRGEAAHLISPQKVGNRPNIPALEEFLIHGLKYAFPAERGEPTRGIPTAYAAPPLDKLITASDDLPPVWPYPEGTTRGVAFEPLYPTVPVAALNDPFLYECLALVDTLRDGRTRERKIAEQELKARLRGRPS
jgi:hypothetical protein